MRSHSSHRSSMSHRSHHSSMHRSSLSSRRHHSSISHSSMHKRHGISNAHAFAVGKATGININGSGMGAHGAALHRMKEMRKRNSIHRSRPFNSATRKSSFSKSSFDNMRVSRKKQRFTSSKYNYDRMQSMEEELGKSIEEMHKYIWIPILIFVAMIIFMMVMFGVFILSIFKIF